MSGDYIDAKTAVEWGFINKSVPLQELDKAIEALALKIAGKSKVAVATGKNLFYQQLEMGLSEA